MWIRSAEAPIYGFPKSPYDGQLVLPLKM